MAKRPSGPPLLPGLRDPGDPPGPPDAVTARPEESRPAAAAPEGEPPGPDGAARPGGAGEGAGGDRPRSAGAGDPGSPGRFVLRLTADRRGRDLLPRHGDGVPETSHAARVTATRAASGQTFFPFLIPAGQRPPPPGADAPAASPGDLPAPPPPPARPATPGEGTSTRAGATVTTAAPPGIAAEKAKARDLLAALRALRAAEREGRPPTDDERQALRRFGGFGAVAKTVFPNPAARPGDPEYRFGGYKDAGCQVLGDELQSLLTPEEYASARRATFSQFFTAPVVMQALHAALARLGVPATATVLEPGCGIGNFLAHAPAGQRFIGVELDAISGRIARALHKQADIRIENIRDTRLPLLDAVIGNVPFADVDLDFHGRKLALHDYCLAKSVEALKAGGVLAVVTSHFTLDKQNASVRALLADQADFLGAVRLPSDAFKGEGTSVVTDILFLRKRAPGQAPRHAGEWLRTQPIAIEGADIPINTYFLTHPEMVLGTWSRKDRLYAAGYSVIGHGSLAGPLKAAIARLPQGQVVQSAAERPHPPPEAAPRFVPPRLERHLTESSLFVGDDKVIYQVIDGQGRPVTYGGTRLKTDGTMTGKRVGLEIEMLTLTRRVLQSQNEGWPEAHRVEARRDLNRAYDRFVHAYGPINKTVFSETKDGVTLRRMPNLTKFREDPAAIVVMALEIYDEATGRAEKAAILKHDVVGPKPPVTSVASAEEGLLVCLDQRGAVDLPFIARLYGKPELEVIAELGPATSAGQALIYHDPQSQAWQTADAYLSGNVRAKLAAAEAGGPAYAYNAEALRAVQPEDVLPSEIEANLGAPWIPERDIQAFAEAVFGGSVAIAHLKKDAVWSVDADYRAAQSVAATSEYGTARIGGLTLFEQALNLKSPLIYDPDPADPDQRVVNAEETLAAKEKQRALKERFRAWIFSDHDRTERLVRLYNDTFNCIRPRRFDGSHLQFPGLSQEFTPRPSQKDAVWRNMCDGNTLVAHSVGGGKTFIQAATAMKMRQTGLRQKPVLAVPNHMLEQFGREFLHCFPNARLLLAGRDDMTKERRKALTAKIATGAWDAVITTHTGFEHIAMSQEFRAAFLRGEIAEYETLLLDARRADSGRGSRNIIKLIEKQKARREEKLTEMMAEHRKDDGLVFDELGIDQIFIDEFQAFKNLEFPTKMDRVAGIPTGGSERPFDLFMKTRYLDGTHAGHGLVGASGTPISNSMVEMYTLQRYFDLQGLKDRGIEHFDAWAGQFGETVESMEIAPDGQTLKARSRFARFVNIPELMQMYRAFADVRTADDLHLPRPRLKGGKAIVVSCPMTDEQRAMQEELVRRYERIRAQKVDPREDNALAITTDGRKLALHPRLLSSTALTPEVTKLDLMADLIAATWRDTEPMRATQLVFCDIGVHPTAWGFSVYDEIIGKLTARGIPGHQIATIGSADTDGKKEALFEKVRHGTVRVLIGSTQKMGAGTNVQKRLIAKHDLDAPWRPCDVEQRDGRIQRPGNDHAEVAIYRYVTEGSFDSYMWQLLETKARNLGQITTGDSAARTAEDIGGQELSYAEVKAIASGNPALLTLAEADAELHRLAILHKNHKDEQYLARQALRQLPATIARLEQRLADLTADLATAATHADDPLIVGERACPRTDALDLLGRRLDAVPEQVRDAASIPLGRYRGLAFGLMLYPNGAAAVYLEGKVARQGMVSRDHRGPRAVLGAVERLAASYPGQCDLTRQDLAIAQGQRRDHEARLGHPFPHAAYQAELTALRDQLKAGLSQAPPEPGATPVAALAERIKALHAAHRLDAPERTVRRRVDAEEPVTSRIRRRAATARAALPPAEADPASPQADPPPAEAAAPARPEEAAPPAPVFPVIEMPPAPARPEPSFRPHADRARRPKDRQRTLF